MVNFKPWDPGGVASSGRGRIKMLRIHFNFRFDKFCKMIENKALELMSVYLKS